jgi:hypothetical protein
VHFLKEKKRVENETKEEKKKDFNDAIYKSIQERKIIKRANETITPSRFAQTSL